MTYRTLADKISQMTDEQKDSDVTIRIDSEYYPAGSLYFEADTDVLYEGHPFLAV